MTSPNGGNFFSKLNLPPPSSREDGESRRDRLDVVAATVRTALKLGPEAAFDDCIKQLKLCNSPEKCEEFFRIFRGNNDQETVAKLAAVLSLLYVEHMQYIAILQDTVSTLTHEDFEKLSPQARANMRTMRRSLIPIFGERMRFTFDEISPHLMEAVFGKHNENSGIDAPTSDAIFRYLFWGGALSRPTTPLVQQPVRPTDTDGAAAKADNQLLGASPSKHGPIRLSWSKRAK